MYYIGTDIVEVSRIKSLIDKYDGKFLNRIFTIEEIDYCLNKRYPYIHFSGRFSAKEAIVKSISSFNIDSSIPLRSINIINNSNGKPIPICNLFDNINLDLSISHTSDYAVAFAIASTK